MKRRKSKKVRVVFVVENLSFPWDKRVWREASTLSRCGYHVMVISPKGSKIDCLSYEKNKGIEVYRYQPCFAKRKIGYFLEYAWSFCATTFLLLRILFRRGFDVVHFANPPDIYFPLMGICRLLGKKIIFDHHDLAPECYLSKYGYRKDTLYYLQAFFEYLSSKLSHFVVVTNESYREIQMKRNRKKDRQIYTVRNGPRLSEFQKIAPDQSLKRGFKYMAAYIGVMGSQDGVFYILEAAKYLVYSKGVNNILFLLIGEGDVWSEMKLLSKEYKLEEFVEFTGRISDFDVRRYLSTADLFLSPDPYNPLNNLSTMNKVMEFMAMGKPFVSFHLKEAMFSGGESGLYVDNNDPCAFGEGVLTLLHDSQKSKEMGAIGERRVKECLAWEHQEKYLLAAYKDILN